MAISLSQLSAASAGPALNKNTPPNFLTVGDSLMWGQGLHPNHRFREMVRSRIAREYGVVTELAMARSGAVLKIKESDPEKPDDDKFHDGLVKSGTSLSPWYSPENFARELPHGAMSVRQQLRSAQKLCQDHWDKNAPHGVRWILLDGGINDIGIFNILTPFRAELDGYSLRCWPTWLLKEVVRIEELMIETLQITLDCFPKAVVIVNGYFPVFSLHSLASVTELKSVGFLNGTLHIVLTSAFGLNALANVSTAWQAASTHHLRRAIRRVLRIPKYAGRTVLFARSNIEGPHSLFGPSSWLWGYDSIPDGIPENISQWTQWFAGATPEDEVIPQRIDQCNTHEHDFAKGIKCRLASIGHPNIEGAVDYANAIIDVMEQAGLLQPKDSRCMVAIRRRLTACRRAFDEGNYRCYRLDAFACSILSKANNAVAGVAEFLIKDGSGRFNNVANNFEDAAECFQNTHRTMAQAAASRFSAASNNFESAGEHTLDMIDCWNDTQNSLQNCDDEKASKIAECNRAYENRVNTSCNIRCNKFTNCNRFSKYNPLRYTCRAARRACVAAAATARSVCRAGAATIREACKAAAEAAAILCKGAEVVENTGCMISKGAQGVWEGMKGIGNSLVGLGAAISTFGRDIGCAFLNFSKGLGNTFLGTSEVILGIIVGLGAFSFYIGGSLIRWGSRIMCRITHWAISTGCHLSNAAISAPCKIRNASSRPVISQPTDN